MIDINAIVNAVIATAVSEATQPLVEHIARLQERLAALENNPVVLDEVKMVEALNSQEWFWEKLSSKAKEIADAAAEEAIVDHCQDYDHDDYDRASRIVEEVDLDDVVTLADLQDTVRDLLNDASFAIRVSF